MFTCDFVCANRNLFTCNKFAQISIALKNSCLRPCYQCCETSLQRTPSGPQNSVRYREVSAA